MEFKARIIRELSLDPYFEIIFTYKDENVSIYSGRARLHRSYPKPEITYDEATLKKVCNIDRRKLELELMNKVIEYIFANGVQRVRSGRFIFNSV